MDCVTLDFETYFGDDYTLSRMSTEEYIRDPRFEAHGAAVKWSPSVPPRWYDEKELRHVLKEHNWTDTFLIHHHANFDGFILSHHYGVRPKLYGCTLNMARLLLGNHIGVSLDSVREQFGIPLKKTPYNLFRGKHWHELDVPTQELVADGACDEVESIWKVFGEMMKTFPPTQLEVVDILIRMFVNPVLQGDAAFFAKVWEAEARKKRTLLQALNLTEADLQSADRFAELLRAEGVEPELKDGKNEKIYAFAKNDDFMKRLPEDENETVSLLAQARLGVKSTIQQTRAATLGWTTSRGPLPVYIRAYGAKTTRPSGGDGSNYLNMKKADPDMPPDDTNTNLKGGICAPPGYLLAEIDAAQIECRILNEVAGQHDVIEKFRNGEDVYSTVASAFYGYPVNKKDHPNQRQLGKVVELQAGYMSGGEKIRATLRTKAKILITAEEGVKARDAYRSTHPAVVDLWKQGGRMIARLAGGPPMQWGPVMIRDGCMWLPNGCPIIYTTLQFHRDPDSGDEYWRIKTRKGWEKTYSGKLVENCLSENTLVLTRKGWKRIIAISSDDSLWDGLEWVQHAGVKSTGSNVTIDVSGVRMTRDHNVLTAGGWVEAGRVCGLRRATVRLPENIEAGREARQNFSLARRMYLWAASAKNSKSLHENKNMRMSLSRTGRYSFWSALSKGLHQTSVWLSQTTARCGVGWEKAAMGNRMRLWPHYNSEHYRSNKTKIVRVQKERNDWSGPKNTWDVSASGACSLEFDDTAMQNTDAPRMEKLWRAWNKSMCALAQFRKFLVRYGAFISTGVNYRTPEQQRQLRQKELLLGESISTGEKPSNEPIHRHEMGEADNERSRQKGRDKSYDSPISGQHGVAAKLVVRGAKRYEPTYDILNCGPRNRFVVLGSDGPFIVHNCIQGLAWNYVSDVMVRLHRMGYRTLNCPYDALLILIPRDGHEQEHLRRCKDEMIKPPPWLPNLPLGCDGDLKERYG